uniref:Uncharacterized protein n=1 Tax=Brassica campestris TaxID=3711 RepID=M4EMC0_BRACM|nr:unnamed protein product [Brassica rapa]
MSSSDTVLAQSGFDAVRCRKICGITLILLDEKWFFKWSLQTNRAYYDTLQASHVSPSTRVGSYLQAYITAQQP